MLTNLVVMVMSAPSGQRTNLTVVTICKLLWVAEPKDRVRTGPKRKMNIKSKLWSPQSIPSRLQTDQLSQRAAAHHVVYQGTLALQACA